MMDSTMVRGEWVSTTDRLPKQYQDTLVKLHDSGETVIRVARLNHVNLWELAHYKAGDHKYQYLVRPIAWLELQE